VETTTADHPDYTCLLRTAQYTGGPEENSAKNTEENGLDRQRTAQNTHSGRLLVARSVFVLRPSHALFQGLYRDGRELHAFCPALEAKPSAYGKLRYAMHLRAHNPCSAQ
jgi:hypothetical protein